MIRTPRPQSRTVMQALLLTQSGKIGAATQLLQSAGTNGDTQALELLGEWQMEGQPIARDLPGARQSFMAAARLGSVRASHIAAALLAVGVGGTRDWNAAVSLLRDVADKSPETALELQLLRQMALDDSGQPTSRATPEVLCSRPWIVRFREFLTSEECTALIAASAPRFSRSVVVDPASGRLISDPVRTSDTAFYAWVDESPFIHAINQRIAHASSTEAMQGEPLHVLRYSEGQQYKPHFDAIGGDPNPRILTALCYLNDSYDGGATDFPRAGLRVKGNRGDLILFANLTHERGVDPHALHAGMPVTKGTKYVASRWIRAKPWLAI